MPELLTENQVSRIFGINSLTVKKLVRDQAIPVILDNPRKPLFDRDSMTAWMRHNPLLIPDDDRYIKKIRAEWITHYPETFAAIKAIDLNYARCSNAQKYPRFFSLVKRPSKRFGFLYYVRYTDQGKLVPSKWNTHTNVLEDAETYARENRSRLLAAYYAKRSSDEGRGTPYEILGNYYAPGSPYLENDRNRGRILGEKTRSVYHHFMRDRFLPYLREQRVKAFSGIDIPLIARFQNHLLAYGLKPQSVNRYLGSVKAAFSQLLMTGLIKDCPFDRIRTLKTGAKSALVRGCHDIDRLGTVFNRPWDNKQAYFLSLLIYSTGMRNSEIERIKGEDIIEIEGAHFIDIKRSKTKNGVRIVPVHPFVYTQIQKYIREQGKRGEDYIFSLNGRPNQSTLYKQANKLLGEKAGVSERELADQQISFYSGRHFWKTLMNAGGLGDDVEEYFMGHKVSGDVAKNYNHKDKQGRGKLIEKALKVFFILDKKLFPEKTGYHDTI